MKDKMINKMINKIHNQDCLIGMKDIPDKSVDMILCDLPYGTTACAWDVIIPFDKLWEHYNRIIKDNGAIVLSGAEPFSSHLRLSNINNYKYDFVWEKNLKTGFLNATKMPMGGHEMVHIFYKKPPTYNPQKKKRTNEIKSGNKKYSKTTVYGSQKEDLINNQSDFINPDTLIKNIDCVHNSSDKFHPTQKPVKLFEYLIKTYTNEDETVLDNCLGSGTTAIACINTKRNYIGFEMDKTYFDLASARIEKHTKEFNCEVGLFAPELKTLF